MTAATALVIAPQHTEHTISLCKVRISTDVSTAAAAAAAAAPHKSTTHQLRHCNPTDLVTLVWSLQRLQLQPPSGWLLQFYSASQHQLARFTDLQLASLAASLDRLLQQQQQQQGEEDQQAVETKQQQQHLQPWQQLYAAAPVPPAVWQLQLELELKSRYRRRRSSSKTMDALMQKQQVKEISLAGAGVIVEQASPEIQQQQQQYQPLWVVGGVLRRWRAAGLGDGWLMNDAAPVDDTKAAQARMLSAV
jgi:hypothetical protein